MWASDEIWVSQGCPKPLLFEYKKWSNLRMILGHHCVTQISLNRWGEQKIWTMQGQLIFLHISTNTSHSEEVEPWENNPPCKDQWSTMINQCIGCWFQPLQNRLEPPRVELDDIRSNKWLTLGHVGYNHTNIHKLTGKYDECPLISLIISHNLLWSNKKLGTTELK